LKEHEKSKKEWDKKAETRMPDPRVIAAFAATKIKFLKKHIGDLENLSTLEVGCGDGFVSRYLMRRTNLVGVDLSAGMLKQNPLPAKALASAYELPFADNSFDLVFESNMLHHIDDPRRAVAEMKRVAGKYLFLSEPNKKSPPVYLSHLADSGERGCPMYDRRDLEGFLLDAGLELVAGASYGRVPPKRTPPFLVGLLVWMEDVIPGGFFAMAIGKIP
jgi:SAM-dependent methyltransferase